MKKIVLIGANPEVVGLIEQINAEKNQYDLIAVLDDNKNLQNAEFYGYPVKGGLECVRDFSDETVFAFGICNNKTRIKKFEILKQLDIPVSRYETLIHPSAIIYSNTKIGKGCLIFANSVIYSKSNIEDFCMLSANCTVTNQVLLCTGVVLGPGVTVLDYTKIGAGTFIGAGSVISENIEIGPGALVGIGSVILVAVKPGFFIMGNPPKGQIKNIKVPEELIAQWTELKK